MNRKQGVWVERTRRRLKLRTTSRLDRLKPHLSRVNSIHVLHIFGCNCGPVYADDLFCYHFLRMCYHSK